MRLSDGRGIDKNQPTKQVSRTRGSRCESMKGGGPTRYKRALLHCPMVVFLLQAVLFASIVGAVTGQEEESHLRRRRRANHALDHNPYWDVPSTESSPLESYNWVTPSPDGSTTNAHDHEKNVDSALVMYTSARDDNSQAPKSVNQERFVDECLAILESNADGNRRINRQGYVDSLSQISKSSLQPKSFSDLPLFLSMIFFSASCTSGEDCVTQEPEITLHSRDNPENQLNRVLCLQLMRFPFLEVVVPFQFLMRSSSGLTASTILSDNENDPIVPTLEVALDQVLLRGFNCTHVEPGGPLPPRPNKRSPAERSKRRQPQPQHDCDYVVYVSVEDAADFRKYN
jgi:hypothetical protein